MKCDHCGSDVANPWRVRFFVLEPLAGAEKHYCSRGCLVEAVAPELKQAVSPKQWIPTPEEEERMAQ